VIAVGNFDGVHRGHQALVAAAAAGAERRHGSTVVLTFDPHPARVVAPQRAPASLMTLEQKAEALAALGVERLAVLSFTPELARQEPERFAADVLVRALGARVVVVGANFRFGRERSGDVKQLRALGTAEGFEVLVIDPVWHAGAPVSSSRVREALAAGDVGTARALLGRSYSVDGTVVHGDGRGTSLGLPTANLVSDNEVLPSPGVYACRCLGAGGLRRAAVANLGFRPTFAGEQMRLEAHLLDFAGDLYGSRLRLSFELRLRDERRFEGPDALRAQVLADAEQARRALRDAV
jgi:riboflavin kinase/FMN adenylyltransferase